MSAFTEGSLALPPSLTSLQLCKLAEVQLARQVQAKDIFSSVRAKIYTQMLSELSPKAPQITVSSHDKAAIFDMITLMLWRAQISFASYC